MKKAYKVCPICNGDLTSNKYINSNCFIVEKKLSFITNSCISYNEFTITKDHDFYQIQSLYGDLFVERFIDRKKSLGIIVDHVNVKTKFLLKLYDRVDETIAEYDKIIDMDYPDLANVKNRMRKLAIFL